MPVKILFVITGLGRGGAEGMLYRLLSRLDKTKFSPHVVSLSDEGFWGAKIRALGLGVTAFNLHENPIKGLFNLFCYFKALKPCLVHTWMYHADLIGGIVARLCGVTNVLWCVRNSDFHPKTSKRFSIYLMRLCGFFSRFVPKKIICCSEAAKSGHIRAGYVAEKFVIIPNGFDLKSLTPDEAARDFILRELNLKEGVFLVGMVGRFDSQKNHEGFFYAAGLISQQLPSAHFLLCGDGIDSSNPLLKRWAEDNQVMSHTHLLGPRDDVPRIMASLDVLCLTSHGEAFPNVLGEAMACEVCCVVTDVGDSASIVGEAGYVVPSGDMTAIAQGVITHLNLPRESRQRLGVSARERVRQLYSLDVIVKQYEDTYLNIIT